MKYSDYIESKQHGSIDLPIEYYYVDDMHIQYHMPLHWHNEFEIVKVLKGSLSLYINNNNYVLYKNDVALIECGFLHRATPVDCIYECVVFNLNMLINKNLNSDRYIKNLINNQYSLKKHIFNQETINISVDKLIQAIRDRDDFFELKLYACLYNFFFLLYESDNIQNIPSTYSRHSNSKTISALLDWIDSHANEQISLVDMAKQCNLSEKYLCSFFKKYTSKTPFEYLLQLRINNACYDMIHTNLSILEISYRNGFLNPSYFSKTFKKIKGISPSQFIKQNKKQDYHLQL